MFDRRLLKEGPVESKNVLPTNLRSKLFEAVFDFMARCGVKESDIRGTFEAALGEWRNRRTMPGKRSQVDQYINEQNFPAQLLRTWHRDSRYIDEEAKPRPLPLVGGRNNLRALMASIDPKINASTALRSMRIAGLVRRTRNGRYLPLSEVAIVDQLHPMLVAHVTRLVSRLISTVGRNSDPTGRSLPLIDRHAYTTDLDPEERQAFADFTRSHGMAYLQSIDDWLEQRRMSRVSTSESKRKARKGVAAGAYLFAYLGDNEGIRSLQAYSKALSPRIRKETSPPNRSHSRRANSAPAARA